MGQMNPLWHNLVLVSEKLTVEQLHKLQFLDLRLQLEYELEPGLDL